MVRRTKEEAEETKDKIVRATLEIFCEKGYSRATFDEIARRINLTKGAVYWHFRNKADILTEIIHRAFLLSRQELGQQVPELKTLEDLRRYLLCEIRLIQQHEQYRKFLFFVLFQMEWSEAILNKVSAELQDVIQSGRNVIKEVLTFAQKNGEISASADIEETLCVISCMWQGILKNVVKPEFKIDGERLLNRSFQVIVSGLKSKESE